MAKATPMIGMTLTMDDGTVVSVFEGDIIRGLTHKVNGELVTIDECAVRVICANTKAQSGGPSGCPPEPYLAGYITVTGIVADSSDENRAILDRIDLANIVRIAEVLDPDTAAGAIVIGPGDAYKGLDEVIADAEPGATIKLLAGTYDTALTVDKNLTIIGDKNGGTVLTGAIKVSSKASATVALAAAAEPAGKVKISLADLTLTGDSLITLDDTVGEFEMRGCVFQGHNCQKVDSKNVMPINVSGDSPILMKVIGNTFGEQNTDAYNLFELNCKLKDGSVFADNTFTLNSCQHNLINIYGIDDGATVKITNNHADRLGISRIGTKGDAKGTIVMEGNSYNCEITEEYKAYAVMFLVQPYGAQSTTMKNLTIIANKTQKPEGAQYVGYLYYGTSGMQFSNDTAPTVIVDGKTVVFQDEAFKPNTVIPCL